MKKFKLKKKKLAYGGKPINIDTPAEATARNNIALAKEILAADNASKGWEMAGNIAMSLGNMFVNAQGGGGGFKDLLPIAKQDTKTPNFSTSYLPTDKNKFSSQIDYTNLGSMNMGGNKNMFSFAFGGGVPIETMGVDPTDPPVPLYNYDGVKGNFKVRSFMDNEGNVRNYLYSDSDFPYDRETYNHNIRTLEKNNPGHFFLNGDEDENGKRLKGSKANSVEYFRNGMIWAKDTGDGNKYAYNEKKPTRIHENTDREKYDALVKFGVTDPNELAKFGHSKQDISIYKKQDERRNVINNILDEYKKNNKKAFGGNIFGGVPVEVEGQEVAQTPQGDLMQFNGASHEQGGVDVFLPPGTEVYSKRIKVDGVSMAERKKNRSKQSVKLEDLLRKNMTDILLNNSLKRQQYTNQQEENADNQIQSLVGSLLPMPEQQKAMGGEKHAWGNPIGLPFTTQRTSYNEYNQPIGIDSSNDNTNYIYGSSNSGEDPILANILKYGRPVYNQPVQGQYTPERTPVANNTVSPVIGNNSVASKRGTNWLNYLPTVGDAATMYGAFRQAYDPMMLTLQNRANDTPNINAFKDYGQEGLKTLQATKRFLEHNRDNALNDSLLSRNAQIIRNHEGARGINTMRALNMATDAQADKQMRDIYSNYGNQLAGILTNEANMRNAIDSQVMQGEQTRDTNDRKDRDNFYKQLSEDKQNMGQMYQQQGKTLNQIQKRNQELNSLNTMDMFGTTDKNGNWKLDERKVRRNMGYLRSVNPKELGISEANWNAMTPQQQAMIIVNNQRVKGKSKKDN